MHIPEEHYVGIQLRKENHVKDERGQWVGEDIILGFATPVSNDAAFKKRKDTVDNWARGYQNKMDKDDDRRKGKNYPNVLAHGFEIAKSVRRSGWSGGNVVWRVIDPRGFELEIPSANLASILDCSTVVNGVIQERCIWGRDGSTNVLLPENSEPYREFVKLTQLKNQAEAKTVTVKDIAPGNIITLINGEVVEYLGKFYCIKHEYLDHEDPATRRRGAGSSWNKVVERFAYKTNNKEKWNATGIELVSKLKVANVVDATKCTDINDNAALINDTECTKRFGEFIFVSPTKLTTKDIKLTVEEVPTDEAIAAVTVRERDRTYVPTRFYFGRNQSNEKFFVTKSYDDRLLYVPCSIDPAGSYSITAHDVAYRQVSGVTEDKLRTLTWYKVTMHFGDHATDMVRY